MHLDLDIVYLQDYLCVWTFNALKIYSFEHNEFLIKGGSHKAIDVCHPITQLRQLAVESIDDEIYKELSNRFTTVAYISKIYQVYYCSERKTIVCAIIDVG